MVPSIAPACAVMVDPVRRLLIVACAVGITVMAPIVSAAPAAPGAPIDTSVTDTVPGEDVFVPVPESVPAEQGVVDEPVETTTTTTLPSAVTTIAPDCPTPPTALAVFSGELVSVGAVSATFRVDQVRAGTLDAFTREGAVEVRYGADARHLETGSDYIVGVVAGDSVGSTLVSSLRDEAAVLGEAEGLVARIDCPEHEPVARTLNIDGTAVATGTFSLLLDSPGRLFAALVLPALLVLVVLVGAVWAKRGLSR